MFFIKKVLILFGGNSSEHYISCKSCVSVLKNIDRKRYDIEVAGISKNNIWYKFSDDRFYLEDGSWKDSNILEIDNIINYLRKFDVVFPVMHGTNAEDGRMQGFLDLFNIKYVGCKTLSSALLMDKAITKLILKSLDIPSVPFKVIKDNYEICDLIENIKFPMIVKPSNGGSSIGISKVNNKKELIKAIKLAKKYDDKLLVEKFINARELEVAVLKDNKNIICSNPGEIKSANEFYDYDAKYDNKDSYTLIPNDLPEDILKKIKEYSLRLFKSLDCSGLSRIDFFYDEENNSLYLNEANTMPGFTTISMYPKLIESIGIEYKDLISILIDNSL